MKETVNFGFKKPESTDFVDVSVFGENFDKIDTELARKTIPIVLNQEIDLTQDVNSIDVTEQVEALADRFAVDLKRGTPVSVSLIHQDKPFVFLLTDWFQHREDYFVVWGTSSNPHDITKISRFLLNVFFGQYSDLQYYADIGGSGSGLTPEQAAQIQANTDAIAAIPVKVSEDGYTEISGQRQATDIQFNRTEQNIEINITMEGNVAYNGNIELDDDGFPVKYTENGREVTLGFTGFDDLLTTLWEGGSY